MLLTVSCQSLRLTVTEAPHLFGSPVVTGKGEVTLTKVTSRILVLSIKLLASQPRLLLVSGHCTSLVRTLDLGVLLLVLRVGTGAGVQFNQSVVALCQFAVGAVIPKGVLRTGLLSWHRRHQSAGSECETQRGLRFQVADAVRHLVS